MRKNKTDANKYPRGKLLRGYCLCRLFGLERTVADFVCDYDQHEGRGYEAEIYLPGKLYPLAVVHAAQGKLRNGAGGPEGVGKAIAILIGKNHYLLIDAEYFTQGTHYGHHHHGLAGTGSHEEVEQSYEQVYYKQGNDTICVAKHGGHGVYKRIDYVAGGEQHGYRTGKADNQRGTDNVLHTLYEVTAGFVGIHFEKEYISTALYLILAPNTVLFL